MRRALTLTLDRAMLPITECKQYNIANGNNADGSVAEGEFVGLSDQFGEPGVATMHPMTREHFNLLKSRGLTTSCYLAQRKLLIRWLLETYNIYRPELEETIFTILNSQYSSGFGNGGPLKNQGHLSFNIFFNSKITGLQRQIDALPQEQIIALQEQINALKEQINQEQQEQQALELQEQINALQGQLEQTQIYILQRDQRIYLELSQKLQCLCLLSSNLFRNMERFSINLNTAGDAYIRVLFQRSQYKPIPCTFVVDDTSVMIDPNFGSKVVIHWYIIYRGKIFSTWGSDTFYIKYSHTPVTAGQFIRLLTTMNALNAAVIGAEAYDAENREFFNGIMKHTMLNQELALSVNNID